MDNLNLTPEQRIMKDAHPVDLDFAADIRKMVIKNLSLTEGTFHITSFIVDIIPLIQKHDINERNNTISAIKSIINADKDTFKNCGQSIKGHYRALILIDEYLEEIKQ